MKRLISILVLGFLSVSLRAAPTPEAAAARAVVLPGGVADADGKVGYVVNEKGGINALDLESGKILWTYEGPAKPLIAFEKKLAVQVPIKDKGNQVRIDILDTGDKGKTLREGKTISFPDWVVTGLTHGRSFSSSAFVDGDNLYLRWEAHAFYAGGAAPTPEILQAAKKDARGVASVSLDSGRVEMLDKDKQPPSDEPKLSDELAKITSQQYFTGSDWLKKPAIVGNTLAALSQESLPENKAKLTLKTWDISTGKAKATVELLTGKELWPLIPAGSKHVFVHQALPKENLPEGDYAWWIFSLETGKLEAKIPFEGAMDLGVVGPRLFYTVSPPPKGPPGFGERPRSLKCIDLKTGKALWESPIEPHKELPPLP
jgi:hypothetical protein